MELLPYFNMKLFEELSVPLNTTATRLITPSVLHSELPCVCVCHLLQCCHCVSAVDHPGTEAGCGRSFVVFARFLHELSDADHFRHLELDIGPNWPDGF